MKTLFTLAALGMFGVGLIGCEARVGDDPDSKHYKKETTTVRSPDGDTKTTTEIKKE